MKWTVWNISLLSLVCLLAGCQGHARPADPVVYLNQSRNWLLFVNDVGGVRPLAREIVRQAFLQAARDELGLTTRDAWLGDGMPTQGDNAPWDVVVLLRGTVTVKMVRGFSAKQVEFSSHRAPRSHSEQKRG